jgi:predicted flap endonuclease-1-like 5' DNA nuclease
LAILVIGFLAGLLVGGVGTTLSGIAFLSLPVLIVGFLIGWILEWIIDNQHRRMREAEQKASTGASVGRPASTDSEIAELTETLKEILADREQELDGLRVDLESLRVAYDRLGDEFDRYAATHPDDLTVIKGIGRVYQWKLRDAGYSTYTQLARADADQVRADLEIKAWQRSDPAAWIAQAQALIERHRQTEVEDDQ